MSNEIHTFASDKRNFINNKIQTTMDIKRFAEDYFETQSIANEKGRKFLYNFVSERGGKVYLLCEKYDWLVDCSIRLADNDGIYHPHIQVLEIEDEKLYFVTEEQEAYEIQELSTEELMQLCLQVSENESLIDENQPE